MKYCCFVATFRNENKRERKKLENGNFLNFRATCRHSEITGIFMVEFLGKYLKNAGNSQSAGNSYPCT